MVFLINSLKNIDDKYKKKDYYNWLITLKENNKIIGAINLNVYDFNPYGSCGCSDGVGSSCEKEGIKIEGCACEEYFTDGYR